MSTGSMRSTDGEPTRHGVAEVVAPSGLLDEHPLLGRRIRGGSWEELGVSTVRLVLEAVEAERWDEAGELAQYLVTEAEVCYRLYRQWTQDLRDFLGRQGMNDGEILDAERRIDTLLHLPDGSAWDSARLWMLFTEQVAAFVQATNERSPQATDLPDVFVETWRRCHDRDVDHISGLMNEVVVRFGEQTIGPMYDHILLPWFDARYSQFDVDQHPWLEALTVNMMVAFEAMRGHLCGPGRRGDIEFEESADRCVIRFDPCGSGGRATRGDDIEGTPPRMEAPYGWAETKEPAPWNHYEPGVCTYCAHCVVLTEIMPIDAFGYPVRAVDPPRYGQTDAAGEPQKCSWTMFKDPGRVPEEYYARVGRTRPDDIGSSAQGGAPRSCGDAPTPPPVAER